MVVQFYWCGDIVYQRVLHVFVVCVCSVICDRCHVCVFVKNVVLKCYLLYESCFVILCFNCAFCVYEVYNRAYRFYS